MIGNINKYILSPTFPALINSGSLLNILNNTSGITSIIIHPTVIIIVAAIAPYFTVSFTL